MSSPLRFLKSHEWFSVSDGVATVGITDFAQEQLNDVVFVDLPKLGRSVAKGEAAAVVESCKTAADVYSPIPGEVVAVNEELAANPGLVNESAFERGWLFRVKLSGAYNQADADYLDKAAYEATLGA